MSLIPSFLLKKPSPTTGLCLIYLQAKWDGRRLLYSTKQNILPSNWSKERQRVKATQATTKDGLYYLNDLISAMETTIVTAYRKESVGGTPTVQQIRKYLDDFFEKNTKNEKVENGKMDFYGLCEAFVKNEVLYKGRPKSESTIACYRTTIKHLKAFESTDRYKITFQSITLEFFYKFVKYLREKGLQQNALNKNIGVVKAFMAEAVDMNLTKNMEFRRPKFGIGQKLVETVYLKDDEILQIYNCDVSYSKNLENVKHAFLISCYTGLRFSDFSTLKIENIQEISGEKFIRKITQKTNEEVILPINDIMMKIIEAYKNTPKGLPIVPCNAVFNKQLKVICKAAGLVEPGRLSEQPEKLLYECCSAHTGRRSFATNAYLKNHSIISIMKLTGHRTEKSFMRYIQLGKLDAARNFSNFSKIDKSKTALKVAI